MMDSYAFMLGKNYPGMGMLHNYPTTLRDGEVKLRMPRRR